MKKILFILLFVLLVSSCEVFTIKGKKIITEETVEQNQNTALGTVFLFVNELNNDNILAATELLVKPDGTFYSASEKYDKSSEVSRMKRFIEHAEITDHSSEIVTENQRVILEFNYSKKATFYLKEINGMYYITQFNKD